MEPISAEEDDRTVKDHPMPPIKPMSAKAMYPNSGMLSTYALTNVE